VQLEKFVIPKFAVPLFVIRFVIPSVVCHSEAQFYRARNLLLPGRSRFLTGLGAQFGMTK
jgi:hypothetical protein